MSEEVRKVRGWFAGPVRVTSEGDVNRIWEWIPAGPDGEPERGPGSSFTVLFPMGDGSTSVRLLTVGEAAAMLEVTPGRVRQLARAGRLGQVHKVLIWGKVVGLVRLDELERYMHDDQDRRRKAEQVTEG